MDLNSVEEALADHGWKRFETTGIWSLSGTHEGGVFRASIVSTDLAALPDPIGWIEEATKRIPANPQYLVDATADEQGG